MLAGATFPDRHFKRATLCRFSRYQRSPGGPDMTSDNKTPKTTDDKVKKPGMMGDGTEEQNLGQPGNPGARITEDEVKDAFKDKAKK
jgi:hypothetical protein